MVAVFSVRKHVFPVPKFAADFIFLRKNHSPQKGVQAAGAKTNSLFSHRATGNTENTRKPFRGRNAFCFTLQYIHTPPRADKPSGLNVLVLFSTSF
jgi:hypothetical protein